eukprot:TRINITY_DN6388_c0_g1_i1.p1 TRINITY_DN6388_c0_g1~~TRINITY_DN6388_c0_g1_i1.p1  ORF type:complete len:205 (+),score=27.98 TRINITY_DN6388_c0_g1_i1:122-736(+)
MDDTMSLNSDSDITFASSCVLLPPPQYWKQIVDIKKNHMNPKIKRPPYPHISLLAPFVSYPLLPDAKKKLTSALASFPPFVLHFHKLSIFDNSSSQTLFLEPVVEPAGALEDLQRIVEKTFPEVAAKSKNEFIPHIGIGFFRDLKKTQALQQKYQKDWIPFSFVVQEIYFVTRISATDPFEVRHVVPLGSVPSHIKPLFIEKPE